MKTEIVRPYRQIIDDLAKLQRQSAAPLFSRRGIVDYWSGFVHTVSGGRVGRPSVATRAACLFEEATVSLVADISLATARPITPQQGSRRRGSRRLAPPRS